MAKKFGGELNLVVHLSNHQIKSTKIFLTCVYTYGDPILNRQI